VLAPISESNASYGPWRDDPSSKNVIREFGGCSKYYECAWQYYFPNALAPCSILELNSEALWQNGE